ncbi:RnfABCDGE type electron transport complex subunit D [Telmatospirillum siberiense]|uniref:Ion-translocating oxidoreductase complex subunit D n=1 Tax=Telmatospirillum siberiense TaxID=382514 RepID=A0A2N3PMV1_9PROT|nr:RnfABCDGE type electron transport complex subunit D [Telmatospirillum siberiense]PKU21713.1 electron transporter RnfD [Telmatospirillum siberiense]
MTGSYTDKSGPFTHGPSSVSKTMTLVLWALVPATVFDAWLFGWPSIVLFLVTIGSCLLVEAGCLASMGKPVAPALKDGSAALTGWLLAMSLPPWAPWWIGVVGAIFAIWLAKHLFGGLGQNVFNPAMVARVALLVSFPVKMTAWVAPRPLFSNGSPGLLDSLAITFAGAAPPDTMSAASALGYVKTELSRGVPVSESIHHVPDLMDMALGMHPGSFGETSALLILAGGLFLMWRKVISWHTPVAVMGSLFVLGSLFNLINPDRFADGLFHVMSGATFLGAFFIATDYVTSPVSRQGQIVYGIGIGLLTWIIRTFAGYPEGMAFAVLLLNALTPIIDHHVRPRVFGRTRKGEPLEVKGGK